MIQVSLNDKFSKCDVYTVVRKYNLNFDLKLEIIFMDIGVSNFVVIVVQHSSQLLVFPPC